MGDYSHRKERLIVWKAWLQGISREGVGSHPGLLYKHGLMTHCAPTPGSGTQCYKQLVASRRQLMAPPSPGSPGWGPWEWDGWSEEETQLETRVLLC